MAAAIGYVNIIKRSGKDGSRFPVIENCLIGSGLHCEIRIHLADVAVEHCLIQCQEGGKCLLKNLCEDKPTKLNDNDVTDVAMLHHGDIVSVSDRLFRWEYGEIKVSPVIKPTVTLLPHNVTDDTGSSKRLVAVVSPQVRDRHETSQSLRTWVLRRSVGNSLSGRSRHPTRTAEERRSTSVVKFGDQDSDQSAVLDKKTPHSVNIPSRTSVTGSVKKSLLKVTPHLRKSVACETPRSVVQGSVSELLETPVSETPRLKNSSLSYNVTPRSRKSKLTQTRKLSHSVPSLKKTPDAVETVAVSSPRRSYRKDPSGVSSAVKSANATPDVKFLGDLTPDFSEVTIGATDSDQPAVPDIKTPHSVNISRRTSIKSSVKKSLLKVTPQLRKSGGVSTVEPIAPETHRTVKSTVRGSVSDLEETPVSKTPRLKNSSVSYTVTPRSQKLNLTQMGKLSHSKSSLKKTPNVEETVAVPLPRRSYSDSLGVSSSVKSTNATPDVKFLGDRTPDFSEIQSLHGKMSQRYSHKVPAAAQSPDLFSSEQVSSNGEMVTLKELQKTSTPALSERPKRKSAGLLLAHIRESQELFSRSRRYSTPSANTAKMNTRSARASMAVPKKSKLSFTPLSQSKTLRKLKSLQALSAKAAKRRLTDVDLSEIAANKLKAESPKTPDKKKMAALLQCHKPRMLFSEVVKKTPVKKNVVAKPPSVPISRRRKIPRKPKIRTPRKAPVKGINSTGHIDSPETIIIHGKQPLKRSVKKFKEENESWKATATAANLQPAAKDIETSVSAQESSREMNTRKSVSFSPAPQVVAFAASRRISTRKSLKIPNISEEVPNNESSLLETQPKRKTSILKKPSSVETRTESMEIDSSSSAITNLESVRNLGSVVSSTPVRVSERQKGRTSSQSPSTPKMTVKMDKSARGVTTTHLSPEALNTSIVSQASTTFDFDAVTTPCISVEKLVSPLNTSSSKKQTNSDLARRNVNISAQQIFKDLVADKVIDSSKWHYHDVNATNTTDARQWSLAMSSGKKSDRRSVSFPVNRYSTRKSEGKRRSGGLNASSNKTAPQLNQHEVAPALQKSKVSANISDESFISDEARVRVVNELEQLSGATVEESPKPDRSSVRVYRKSQQSATVHLTGIENAKEGLRSSEKSLSDGASFSKGNVKQQSLSVRQRKSTTNDLTDVRGVRRLFDQTNKRSPINDLTDVRGVRKLLKSPKQQKSPRNDLTDVKGIKRLLKTPRIQKSPRNDLTDVKGVKQLLRTPRIQKSPRNDLTDVKGVKQLLKSPRIQKSPRNDLTDVKGIKQLLKSPRMQKSPRNDLSDVRGVKQLFEPPEQQKSPRNDLTDVRGVKELFRSTRKPASPENDLSDVRGVKRLLHSPLQRKSPYNDLRDVRGVKNLFRSSEKLKSPKNDLSDVTGVSTLFNSPRQEILSANKKSAVQNQELSLSLEETQGNVMSVTKVNKDPIAEQEVAVPLGAKRRKLNIQEKETNNSSKSEEATSVSSYSTRGKRAKKSVISFASGDVDPQLHKNTNQPRTRRGKVQGTAENITVSDEKELNSDKTDNMEQRDLLILSNTGHILPNITNSPRTRRTRKQVVTEQLINSNVATSPDSTSSPRTLRGKKVTIKVSKESEEVKSKHAVESDNSVKELFAHPVQLASLETASSPKTRRGRKQIVGNQKADVEVQQLHDVLQKHEQDGLIKTSQLGSSSIVSPLKTRRGKKYIEKNQEQDEELKSVSHADKLKPEVESHRLLQNSELETQSVNNSEPVSLHENGSPKIRGGNKAMVTKQQRSKPITLLTDKNTPESKDSEILSVKPQQKRVIFADVIQAYSPSNSSPRTRRGKKQVVSNDELGEEQGLKSNNQLLPDIHDKPLGKRQRKTVNAGSTEGSPSGITEQTRSRRGRKIHPVGVNEELKLALKTSSLHNNKTDETATGGSGQSKVTNNSDSVVFVDSSTVSPLKPRRGRKVAIASLTADTKERVEVNQNLENNVATAVAHTSDTDLHKSSTSDVPDLTSSKRTLRGKKQNDTQVTVTTEVSSDTSGIEEKKVVRSTRTGRKRAVNLEIVSSAVSTDMNSSKDTAIANNSPPKRSRRVRIRGDVEEKKPSPHSEMVEPDLTHVPPNEASEEGISSRRRGVRKHKKEANKNEEPEQEQSADETKQRSTRSKRKNVQENAEPSPKKKKNTQSDRLSDVSPQPKVASPRATRQRKNRCT